LALAVCISHIRVPSVRSRNHDMGMAEAIFRRPRWIQGGSGVTTGHKIQVMNTNRPATVERIRFPWWLIALAVVGFLGVQVLVYFATLKDPPPLAVRIFLLPFAGLVVAFYILVAGYVNRDAKRRGMNSLVWTLLVIFIPNAIGFIIYFLTRRPLLLRCPQCSSQIEAGFTYCPGCSYKLTPTCPECNRSITITGAFCPYCGRALRATAPAEP
jgi:double zinc ribbon protein